jgi:hypothetical protein
VDVDKIDDPVNRAAKISQISNFGQIPKQLFKDRHPAKNMQKLQQTLADCVFSHTLQLSPFQIGTGGAVGSIVFINEVPVMLAPRKVKIKIKIKLKLKMKLLKLLLGNAIPRYYKIHFMGPLGPNIEDLCYGY